MKKRRRPPGWKRGGRENERGSELSINGGRKGVFISVLVIEPPTGTEALGGWIREDATRSDVLGAINAAPIRRLSVGSGVCGAHRARSKDPLTRRI